MPRLGVNIDHIATLREARKGIEPEPVFAALICEAAGADGIVVHLREDRRHIKERDVYILRQVIRSKLNLEMSIAADILDIACDVKPDQATLVPEKRQELTTEGGLDVAGNPSRIKSAVRKLEKNNIPVSLFIDPDKRQISAAKKTGARFIELHTGRYAGAKTPGAQALFFKELIAAAKYARGIGIEVFAGHGLDYHNVMPVARISGIEELNIGHSIISRAALAGLERAVKEMKALIG
ncbi:MAG: pyridoxine 5'-phosphate synthase [Candidatus Omnitrophica bacterium]|nr:pyridoxine 5'-phosphate synthase [Candidatus Omnitrophota bacterium]